MAIENVVGECIKKCAQVVLNARTYPAPPQRPPIKPNRWFQVELDELPEVRSFLEPCKVDPFAPVELEVYCSPAGRQEHIVIERWRLLLEPAGAWPAAGRPAAGLPGSTSSLADSNTTRRGAGSSSGGSGGSGGSGRLSGDEGLLYKKLTLLVRLLCCHLRSLPTHRLVKAYKRQPIPVWRLGFRLTRAGSVLGPATLPSPSAGQELACTWAVAPVMAVVPGSQLTCGYKVRVDHLALPAIKALEELAAACPSLPSAPKVIINDYVTAAAATSNITPSSMQRAATQPLPITLQVQFLTQMTGQTHDSTKQTDSRQPTQSLGAGLPAPIRIDKPAGKPAGSGLSTAASVPAGLPATSYGQSLSSTPVRKSWGRKPTHAATPFSPDIHVVRVPADDIPKTTVWDDIPTAAVANQIPVQQGVEQYRTAAADSSAAAAVDSREPYAALPARRSVSTPDSSSATVPTVGSCVVGVPPSAPVQIPTGSQQRVRSLADMQVVYNFPDNPTTSGTPSSTSGRPLTTRQSGPGAIPHTHHHIHGSAPAAPRGMLGQALEAHLAAVKARAPESLGVASLCPPDSKSSPPHSSSSQAAAAGVVDDPGIVQTTDIDVAGQGTAGDSKQASQDIPPQPITLQVPVSGSVQDRQSSASGSDKPSPQEHDITSGSSGHHHASGGGSSASRGWQISRLGAHGLSASPSLPFAFTPSAQSLGISHTAHGGRFLTGSSVHTSPSWTINRPHGSSSTAHGQGQTSTAAIPTNASAAAGGSVIIGRDVTSLALARRPSWIEHTARVGRSSSGQLGDMSPGDSASLGSSNSRKLLATGQSLPAAHSLGTALHAVGSHHAMQQPHAATPSRPPLAPSPQRSFGPGSTQVARSGFKAHQHSPWQPTLGAASWLQAPNIAEGSSLQATHSIGLGTSPFACWPSTRLDDILPPPVAVTVNVPPAEDAVEVDTDAEGYDGGAVGPVAALLQNDDLAFILDPEPVAAGKTTCSVNQSIGHKVVQLTSDWVQALDTYTQRAGTGICQTVGSESEKQTPGDIGGDDAGQSIQQPAATIAGAAVLLIPDRDIAVGSMLLHLQHSQPGGSNKPTSLKATSGTASVAHASYVDNLTTVNAANLPAGLHDDAASQPGLTCGAAFEQLSDLHNRLAALLSAAS